MQTHVERLHRRLRRAGTSTALTLAVAALALPLAAPATAAPAQSRPQVKVSPGGTVVGPLPVPEPPFTIPRGQSCAFGLKVIPTVNHTMVVRFKNARGRVTDEFYYGKLLVTATNLSTGAHEGLNLSASGLFEYAPDGTTTIYGIGPYGLGLHPGDHPGPFYAVPSGVSKVTISPSGVKTVNYATRLRNVCTDLS